MAAISKHHLDIFNWIKQVIDSSDAIHLKAIERLIENYRKLLDHKNLEFTFKSDLLRELHIYHLEKINNFCQTHIEKIKEISKEI